MPENDETIDKATKKASDYLVVEDSEKPSTFHLQVKVDGKPDHNLMGAAWAALHGGYRGNKYEGPSKSAAIAALKKLYEAEKMTTPKEKDMGEDGKWSESQIVPVEVVSIDTTPPPAPPTTFVELEQIEAAQESAHEIDELNCTFGRLTGNIMQSKTPEQVGPAMIALATEYQAKITEAMQAREKGKSLVQKAVDAVGAFAGRVSEALAGGAKEKENGVMFYKDTETGGYRWLGVYSNKFRDRDNPPEIISSAAHKEFAQALENGEWPMPELRLWHVLNGRPLGRADTVAWDDSGFMVASGLVDKGLEHVADAMQGSKFSWLMSHGMPRGEVQYDQNDKTVIVRYRSKELTALPEWAAANALTMFDFAPNEGGVDMAFSDKDKEKLTKMFGGDKVAAIEGALATTAQKAKDSDIQSKEKTEPVTLAPVAEQTDQPAPEAQKDDKLTDTPAAADKPSDFVTRTEAAEAIAPIVKAVQELTEMVKALKDKSAAQDEDKVKQTTEALKLTPSASLGELIAQSITKGHPAAALVKGREAILPKEAQPNTSSAGDSNVMKIPFLAKLLTKNGTTQEQE